MHTFRLFLAAFLMLLATAPAAIAAPAPVDDILEQHRRHGYPSPLVAMQRLLAASDRPADDATLAQRQRYYAALATYAIAAGQEDAALRAQAQLERLADREACAPCRTQWLVRQVTLALGHRELDRARRFMQQLRSARSEASPELRLEIEAAQAMLFQQSEEFDRMIETALGAAELAARLERPADQAALLGLAVQANIGRGDLERALELSHEVYALAERIGYTYEMALTRTNQGYVYGGNREDYPEFYATLKDALRLSKSVPGMEHFYLTTLINLSAYHIYVHVYPQSIEVTRRAEKLALQLGDELSRAFAISNRGSAMARLGQVDAGLALMQQASDVADRAGDKRASIDLLNEKVNVYELVGRQAEALKALRRVVALEAELTQRQRENALQEIQAKFSAERKTREIERLSSENARRQAEVDARTWQQRLWAAVAVALALAAALLVQLLKRTRHANRRLAVDNAALVEASSHDALTGAFNRRHCQRLMARYESLQRAGAVQGVGLVVLDVDHFKTINDAHGHQAGDAVLVELARRLQALVRQQDAVVRWGGEEFVLVLPDTPVQALAVLADRVLRAVGDEPVTVDGQAIPVTVSLGAVAFPFHAGQHWEDALHVADVALYRSKAGGRNRATCLVQVAADAQPDRLRRDLAAAQAAGEAVLQTVVGAAAGGAAARMRRSGQIAST